MSSSAARTTPVLRAVQQPDRTWALVGDLAAASDADLAADLKAADDWAHWEKYQHSSATTSDQRYANDMIGRALRAEIKRRAAQGIAA